MNVPLPSDRARYSFAVGAASDPGVVRSRNEDSYCVILEADDLLADPVHAVVAVADGMGGHDAGDVASSLVVGRVRTAFTTLPGGDLEAVRETLNALAGRASAELYAEARERDAPRGMGSTMTVLILLGDRILTAHIGDTRLYRWRDQSLEQLTDDHTWAAEQDRMGVAEEGRSLGGRNLLTRCLGIDPKVTADLGEHEIRAGDRLLLCSDGLHGPVDDSAIAETLGSISKPQEAATRLVQLAIAAGAPDNVTAVVADVLVRAEGGVTDAPSDASFVGDGRAVLPVAKTGSQRDGEVPGSTTTTRVGSAGHSVSAPVPSAASASPAASVSPLAGSAPMQAENRGKGDTAGSAQRERAHTITPKRNRAHTANQKRDGASAGSRSASGTPKHIVLLAVGGLVALILALLMRPGCR